MDNLKIFNFEISDDSIPNFEDSEADANALVQYAMRKRGQHRGGPLFQPRKNDEPKAGFNVQVKRKPSMTKKTDAGIPQAECPSKIVPRLTEPRHHSSLARRVLMKEFDKTNPRSTNFDAELTMNGTLFANPQASSTPAPRPTINPLVEPISASTHKSVQIPGVEINISLNHSKKTSPNPEMNMDVLPVLPKGLTTPERRSVAHLTPTRPATPKNTNLERRSVAPSTPSQPRTPRQLAEKLRTPSIKEKFLAELDSKCNAAKAAIEAQASVAADPVVLSASLCSPGHRVLRSLQFGSPKLTTVQQANIHDIATQPQVLEPPNAIITLNVVVDHQQNKIPSIPTEETFISERTQTVNAVNSTQSAMCNERNSNIEQPIFKTPHIPQGRTASQTHFKQPIPAASFRQLSNETDVDAFWLNFDDKIGASPTESKISRTSFAIPRYINPHKIVASQTFNSQRQCKRATLTAIENLERTIQDSQGNPNSSTRRILYKKRDASPKQKKIDETTSSKSVAISKTPANQVTRIPLTEQQEIVPAQRLLETCHDSSENCIRQSDKAKSRKLYPKIVLTRFDDPRGSKSTYRIENHTNIKSMVTTKMSLKRNRHDAIIQQESSSKRARPSTSSDDEIQLIPLKKKDRNKNNTNASHKLKKKRKGNSNKFLVENYDKGDCRAEGRSPFVSSPHSHRQMYSAKTIKKPVPTSFRTRKRSTLVCPSESSVKPNGARNLSFNESQFEEGEEPIPEDQTIITEDNSECSLQPSESDSIRQDSSSITNETEIYQNPDEDESSLDELQGSAQSHTCNSISLDLTIGENTQERTQDESSQQHNNEQAAAHNETENSNYQYNESDFKSPDDDECTLFDLDSSKRTEDDKNSQKQTHFRRQSGVQLKDFRSMSENSLDDFQSIVDDEDLQELESSQNQSNVQSSVQEDSRQSSMLDDSRLQTNLSEQNDSSDIPSSEEDETSRTDLRNFCKEISIRASIDAAEKAKHYSALQNASKRGDNSAASSSSSTTQSVASFPNAAAVKRKVGRRKITKKIKFVEERYDPSKRRVDVDDASGLRRSKREYQVPRKYWTNQHEPISPIVLTCTYSTPGKKSVIRKQSNKELARAHLDIFNSDFSFLRQDRNSVITENITDLIDGVVIRGNGITFTERLGVQYYHYATKSGNIQTGYIQMPPLSKKKKSLTNKLLDILVLKGSVSVMIGVNNTVAMAGDQIRINEGISYEFENTEQTDALLYYTK